VKIAICDTAGVEQLPVVPTTPWRLAKPEECVVYPDLVGGSSAPRYYLGPAGVTASDIKRARAEFVAGQGWTVKLTLTKAGSRAWDALAEQQFHQQVAITASGTRKQAEALALLAAPDK
jgi:preprotein translocase subunit SecD